MQNNFIELIEPTPKLNSKICRLGAFVLSGFLSYFPVIGLLMAWYMYDYFIAGTFFLLSYLVVGILRAKLRNDVIPMKQSEYHYNDKGIATWYFAKRICDLDQ
jgi:hypothetical protein